MNNSTKNTHYKEVAANYANFWFYETGTPYELWKLKHVIDIFNLHPSDRLCDLGGGSGHFSNRLSQMISFNHKALVVDPCEEFINQAALLENLAIFQADAATFITSYSGHLFDKILLKEVVHHLPKKELTTIFRGLRKQLNSGGQLLIMTRPKDVSHFPFFKKALKEWSKEQESDTFYSEILSEAGFSTVSSLTKSFPIQMTRNIWYQLLKQRFWSNLDPFSDIEIDKGIQEIEEIYPKGDILNFVDKSVFILASKH